MPLPLPLPFLPLSPGRAAEAEQRDADMRGTGKARPERGKSRRERAERSDARRRCGGWIGDRGEAPSAAQFGFPDADASWPAGISLSAFTWPSMKLKFAISWCRLCGGVR